LDNDCTARYKPIGSYSMDLFERAAKRDRRHQPLAERMRPESLEEVVGQEHLLGPGKLLAYIAEGAELPSLILWGPPGTGKTTLARLLADRDGAHFDSLSAVLSGVKQLREVAERARERQTQYGKRTILFIDEIHRFSKSQQDALLPHVEAGTVTLIGATTENPAFEINAPLLSRARVVRLEALGKEDLESIIDRALTDKKRGLGERGLSLTADAREALISQSGGDARRLLNTLEVAAELARSGSITEELVAEAAQQKTLLYDKAGDEHYGVVSAFIKSMRGSDPDAAAYWLVRMLEAGEDPLFVLRRMVIFASEDIGNADPRALSVATAALDAFQFVGLPEGVLPMTQAAVYLACAPKSNTALTTYSNARKLVRDRGSVPVPAKLRNAVTSLSKSMGHGKEYKYPHDFEGHYVPETYLPDSLVGTRLYEPTESGYEAEMKARLERMRRKS
jgi:putative ATPase